MPSILNATTTSGLVTSADNSGSLQLQTNNGTTAVTIDTSQNVGIGTATPSSFYSEARNLVVGTGTGGQGISIYAGSASQSRLMFANGTAGSQAYNGFVQYDHSSNALQFGTNGGTERMRIDSDGNLLLGVSSSPLTSSMVLYFDGFSRQGLLIKNTANSSNGAAVRFMDYLGNVSGGGIFFTSSNSITYATSSDYRLKENIAPMTGALEKVTQLKPCTFQWTVDGSDGQGFIAHELQEVIPNAVVGKKDAVDAEGNPRYQGVDTSFLVATLTAAIQELKAELDATKAEVQALKGVA